MKDDEVSYFMRLIITRHGESEENSQKILQGLLPGKLSEIGKQQAEKLGKRLARENIDVIYCSPVSRCKETLEMAKQYINEDTLIIYSDLIQERDFGQLSGKKHEEIDFGKLDVYTEENKSLGVESLEGLLKRIRLFLEEIKNKHIDDTVLVVTHSNPIRMMLAELMGKTYLEVLEEIRVSNASVSIFEISENEVRPVVINEIDFLG